jgi:hypothetical protein
VRRLGLVEQIQAAGMEPVQRERDERLAVGLVMEPNVAVAPRPDLVVHIARDVVERLGAEEKIGGRPQA